MRLFHFPYLVWLLGLSLTACASEQASRPLTASQQACQDKGGVLTQGMRGEVCARPHGDANQPCTQNDQCEGLCIAPVSETQPDRGRCAPHSPYFGCFAVFESEGQSIGLCVD